ncbi:MAG: hypothetical protein CSA38_04605 [Flavobacteriales bacterium]|nr:MAG: hypothetical protein CSA38_04605 [Flavobacteriales bacterium]
MKKLSYIVVFIFFALAGKTLLGLASIGGLEEGLSYRLGWGTAKILRAFFYIVTAKIIYNHLTRRKFELRG